MKFTEKHIAITQEWLKTHPDDSVQALIDTLTAALRVVRAAQVGYPRGSRVMDEALKPFSSPGGKEAAGD